jgi:hypothetical protein
VSAAFTASRPHDLSVRRSAQRQRRWQKVKDRHDPIPGTPIVLRLSALDSRAAKTPSPIADDARPASIHVNVYKDPGANFRWNARSAAVNARGGCHSVVPGILQGGRVLGCAAPAWPLGRTVNRSASSLEGSWVHSHLLSPHRLRACVRSQHGRSQAADRVPDPLRRLRFAWSSANCP